jgi:hypothetical protein
LIIKVGKPDEPVGGNRVVKGSVAGGAAAKKIDSARVVEGGVAGGALITECDGAGVVVERDVAAIAGDAIAVERETKWNSSKRGEWRNNRRMNDAEGVIRCPSESPALDG